MSSASRYRFSSAVSGMGLCFFAAMLFVLLGNSGASAGPSFGPEYMGQLSETCRTTRGSDVLAPTRRTAVGAASFQRISQDRKLSPVEKRPGKDGNARLVNVGPRVSSTYAAISATCTETCVFKSGGCFVQTGSTANMARAQDEAARGYASLDVMREEAALINRAYKNGVPQDGGRDGQRGRDLRLHVGGDVGSEEGARLLAGAARAWRARRGGTSWTYTHLWREVPRSAFGGINVLASVETPEDIEVAATAGYPAAITVDTFASKRTFKLPGANFSIIPCPAEASGHAAAKGVTCATCRLCLDRDLLKLQVAIGFEAHGPAAASVRERLTQLRRNDPPAKPGAF